VSHRRAPRHRWVRAAEYLLAVLAVAALGILAYSAGWSAGTRAGGRAVAEASGAAAEAAAAQSEAYSAAASAAAAEAAVRAGTPGLCWQASHGRITEVAPPEAVPGGETCPAGPWRYTPALPQPGPVHTSPA
jgi:hypothetical protein